MPHDNDQLQHMSKYIQGAIRELNNSAKMMGSLSEELSNSGLDKLTGQIKEALKAQKLITEADYDNIKSARDLQKVLEETEERFDRINKIQRRRDAIESELHALKQKHKKADANGQRVIGKSIKDLSRELDSASKELGQFSDETIKAHREGLPIIREQIRSSKQNIGAFQRLGKQVEGITDGYKKQVSQFFTASVALDRFTKGIATAYDQMSRLSERGMLGAIKNINLAALKLLTNSQEVEKIFNANRDIINQLGGGQIGIDKFTNEILRVKEQVAYLGKNANEGAARLIQLSNAMGITVGDGKDYDDQLRLMVKQSKVFAGMWGDTIDQYAALLESQTSESNLRAKLNNLSKTEIFQANQEIMKRTENLKLMGLSNEQIVDFNNKLQNILDPKKNNIQQRVTESVMMRNEIKEAVRVLKMSGKQDNINAADAVEKNMDGLEKILSTYGDVDRMSTNDVKKIIEENPEAAKAYSMMQGAYQNLSETQKASMTAFRDQGGVLSNLLTERGQTLKTAEVQNRDRSKDPNLKEKMDNAVQIAEGKSTEGVDKGVNYGEINEWMNKITGVLKWLNETALGQLGTAILALVGTIVTLGKGLTGFTNLIGKLFQRLPGAPGSGGSPGSPPGTPGSPNGKTSSPEGSKPSEGKPGAGTPEGSKPSAPDVPKTGSPDTKVPEGSKPSAPEAPKTKVPEGKPGMPKIGKMGRLGKLGKIGGGAGGVATIGIFLLDWLFGDKIDDYLPWAKAGETMEDEFWKKFEDDMEDLSLPKYMKEQRRADRKEKELEQHGQATPNQPITKPDGTPLDPNYGVQSRATGQAKPLLDLIGRTEGTDKGRGYNETLGYGAYTGGPVDLTNMSISDVYKLQKKMLVNPNNKFNSSAVGRYQIVNSTLEPLVNKLGIDPKTTKFTPEIQDQLATELLKQNGMDQVSAGKMSIQEFMNRNAKTWASLPDSSGRGAYANQRVNGNTAQVLDATQQVVQNKGSNVQDLKIAKEPTQKPDGKMGPQQTPQQPIVQQPKIEQSSVPPTPITDMQIQAKQWMKMAKDAQNPSVSVSDKKQDTTSQTQTQPQPIKPEYNKNDQQQPQSKVNQDDPLKKISSFTDSILGKQRSLGPTPDQPSLATPGYFPQPSTNLASNTNNFSAPTARAINSETLVQPKDAPVKSTPVQNTVASPVIPVDPTDELKKQTELLSAIVRNTMPGKIPTSISAYQEDRAKVLNGMG